MDAYEAAVTMYRREHERWHNWALFFFGSVGGIFLVHQQAKDLVPLSVAAVMASVVSFLWVWVSLGIRGWEQAWFGVLTETKMPPPTWGNGNIFKDALQRRGAQRLDVELAHILTVPRQTFSSAITTLTVLGLASGCLLAGLAVADVVRNLGAGAVVAGLLGVGFLLWGVGFRRWRGSARSEAD